MPEMNKVSLFKNPTKEAKMLQDPITLLGTQDRALGVAVTTQPETIFLTDRDAEPALQMETWTHSRFTLGFPLVRLSSKGHCQKKALVRHQELQQTEESNSRKVPGSWAPVTGVARSLSRTRPISMALRTEAASHSSSGRSSGSAKTVPSEAGSDSLEPFLVPGGVGGPAIPLFVPSIKLEHKGERESVPQISGPGFKLLHKTKALPLLPIMLLSQSNTVPAGLGETWAPGETGALARRLH